jgi:hypothetical protein
MGNVEKEKGTKERKKKVQNSPEKKRVQKRNRKSTKKYFTESKRKK